jgi:hypothetical protein
VGDDGSVRPSSFAEELIDDWSEWVLDSGLPDLPDRVEIGQAIPIAYWAGPVVGAVLHRQWSWSDEHDDDQISDDIQHFWRMSAGWLKADAEGGSSGGIDGRLTRVELPTGLAVIGGGFQASEAGRFSWSLEGYAAADVSTVEVHDSLGVTRRPIDSPLGYFIAATGDRAGASIVLRDATGSEVLRSAFGP